MRIDALPTATAPAPHAPITLTTQEAAQAAALRVRAATTCLARAVDALRPVGLPGDPAHVGDLALARREARAAIDELHRAMLPQLAGREGWDDLHLALDEARAGLLYLLVPQLAPVGVGAHVAGRLEGALGHLGRAVDAFDQLGGDLR